MSDQWMLFPRRRAAGGGGGGSFGAHRYWRTTGFLVSGSTMAITEWEPQVSSVGANRITYTSSDTPTSGSLSALFDQNLTTRCYWDAAIAEAAGFWIKADFGAPVAIDEIRLGGFDTSNRYPSSFDLQYSDDNSSWTTQASASGLTYPGNNTLSGAIDLDGGGTPGQHRYWRIINIVIGGAFLEISEIRFYAASTQIRYQVTSSDAPSVGTLDRMNDGDVNLAASWADTVAEAGGFFIAIDYGHTVSVTGMKFGANSSATYPSQVTLEYSDDNSSWTVAGSASGLPYPGDNTLSAEITFA